MAVLAVDGPRPATLTAGAGRASGSTAVGPPQPAALSTTTVSSSVTTTVVERRPPAPASTTVPGPAGGTTSTTEPAEPSCFPSELEARISTDRAVYTPRQTVIATATIRNVSDRACYWGREMLRWIDQAGAEVWGVALLYTCPCEPSFLPGQTQTYVECWSQEVRSREGRGGAEASPGRYAVVRSWDAVVVSAEFELVAEPPSTSTTSTTATRRSLFGCPGDQPPVFPLAPAPAV